MTENDIIFDVLETLRGNQIIDDVDIDGRQIMFAINNQRHLLIRNEYNKPGRSIDPQITQDLGCVKLIEVDAAECCDTSISADCMILRTEDKIPPLIEFHNGISITRVGPITKTSNPYSLIPYARVQFSGDDKYGKNIPQAFYLNGYVYLIAPTIASAFLEYINIQGVFETPFDVAEFTNCDDNTTCYDRAITTYPLAGWMYAYLKAQVLQQFAASSGIPKDSHGDSQEILAKQ